MKGNTEINLASYHTFGIDVKAQQIQVVTTIDQLYQYWQQARAIQQPVLLLGGGSNVLFVEDFQGRILLNQIKGITQWQDEDNHYFEVKGGENWHQFVENVVAQGIGGLENLALIPGCVGSAPIQNIGAYGVEFQQVCLNVKVLNLQNGEIVTLQQDQCQFDYRDSIFKQQYKEHYAVVAVTFKLTKHWQPNLKYAPLDQLDPHSVTPQQIFDQVCAIRQTKLPHPKQLGNAGSFFKNPIVPSQHFDRLFEQYPNIPYYPQPDGSVKLAAGWLIDQCGLKGFQLGGAAVHQQQALVLVNYNNATSTDIVELAHHIRQKVAYHFDVWLEPEVRFIGANGEINAVEKIS
ncbi:UDP-N-acetylenolpyruvoylglucosamine reductase [Mergibacter septicus]|uniref:UDP-N-acetylenolpyruvoylglucosamine reductase n=1 Tax=Mergibacter septicus TaxID=221402 RepID=A0A8D4J0A3_9PAST|nr:UDP-N-acetylmuramate dehydrogenase [Mergibacter septicus]AWX15944.1 UDP-N-acetylenolpyruvoylglucosamine reductase [Mergibacter septicus]QDJ15197.1 UDP-N-acetylenolpyruvoylglucosamine reductase [Mergibacter septicus]WMR95438.1 UDP-N-acetylmuramate dehydrogenase [Mergibacter septicus]